MDTNAIGRGGKVGAGPGAPAPGTRREMVIGGRVRMATLRRVAASKVVLDAQNPRVRYTLAQRPGPLSQGELKEMLMRQPGTDDLMRRVRDNKGLLDPIFLRPDYRVIEGNCRTAVCLHLSPAHPHLAVIPAWVFDEIDDRDAAVLQGAFHVAGKMKWRAHEQAGHIHHMRHQLGIPTPEIAKEVGLQERVVKRLLETYDAMNVYVLPVLKHNGLKKFSYFAELYKRDDLEDFRAKPANVKLFSDLVIDGRINKGLQVRWLPEILKHGALPTLRKSGFDAALAAAGKVDPTAGDPFLRKLQNLAEALRNPPASLLRKLRDDANALAVVNEVHEAASSLVAVAQARPLRNAKKGASSRRPS